MLQSNNILFLDTLAMAPPPGESGGGLMGFLPMILIFCGLLFSSHCTTKKKTKTTPEND